MGYSTKLNMGQRLVSLSQSLTSLDDLKFGSTTLSNTIPRLAQLNNPSIQQLLSEDFKQPDLTIDRDLPTGLINSLNTRFNTANTVTNGTAPSDLTEVLSDSIEGSDSISTSGYCSICAACGIGHGHSHAGLEVEGGVAQFNAGNSKWSQPNGTGTAVAITYSFAPNFQLSGLNRSQSETLFEEALGVWAEVAPLNFTEIEDPGNGQAVDIRVQGDFIDGRFGTLAFAFFPRGGDQTYDTGENWNSSLFLETAVHEIGHSLGLGHESGVDAIMNPSIQGRFNGAGTAFLLPDDINGIRSLYGNGQGSVAKISQLLSGDNNNNTLTGSIGDDTILGFGGNDVLNGQVGDDLIRGSNGQDTIIGSFGKDTLFGGNGNDLVYAGPGNDIVYGSRGHDRLIGGNGNDRIYAGQGNDIVYGSRGNDYITGDYGNDKILGGSGRDILIGVFTDQATPGTGEIDTLEGGQGPDTFILGDSGNVYYADNNPTVDYALIRDFQPEEGDQLQLKGNANNYSLQSSTQDLPAGITITYEAGQTQDIIAVIQGTSTFSLTDSSIRYV